MKDIPDPNVNGSDVERTDAPVMTSDVISTGVARSSSMAVSIVEAAFDAHAGHLKAFARAAVRDDDAADDLVQETFLRLVPYVREQGAPDNVGGWLHRVCANLIISRGRRTTVAARRKSLLVDRDVAASPEDMVIRSDEGSRLRAALADLPNDARVALLMAAAGFSTAEIAEAIGRSANATSTYICRARMRLREILSGAADGTP